MNKTYDCFDDKRAIAFLGGSAIIKAIIRKKGFKPAEEGEMPKHKVPPKSCGNCRHFDDEMNYCDEIAIITSAECPPCEAYEREDG